MKHQATQVMWFFDRQHDQWSLSDQGTCQQWQGKGVHPWADQLLPEDEAGFADFLIRLHESHLPEQFIGHLRDKEGALNHVLWSGQFVPNQEVCCGWLIPLAATSLKLSLPLLQTSLLTQLAQALSARTGLDFFNTLVKQLSHILQVDAVWVGELSSADRVRVLAADGLALKDYPLAGTPCQQLYRQGAVCLEVISEQEEYQPWLAAGQTYYGQPLFDGRGQLLGHLALLSSAPADMANLNSVLNTFTVRMVAELERLQSDAQMRLSAVAFETHEGIIITDPGFKILRVNNAFSQITGFDSQAVLGLQLEQDLWPNLGGLGYELNPLSRWQGETQRLHADGHTYPQWEIVTPVQDEKGGISHFVICFEDISERKAAERRIQDLAYYDELTGLPNRRQLHETLVQTFNEATHSCLIGALLFIDLDHFKTINDSLGHATGDWLLKEVATRLKRLVRQGDCLARLGGDEFVLLLPSLSASPPQAEMQADIIAERLITEIAAPYTYAGQVLHIGASVGITLFPDREQGVDDLLKQADTAMYQAKSAGRKTRRFFDASMQQQADRRLHIHNELRNALNQQELTLYYQPQHLVDGGDIIGVEALIRWQPAGRALVSPAEFIPIAEESDLIVDIGNWVLHEACAQYVMWEENGIHIPQISVNVSAKQFHATDFVERIHDVLAQTGMDPACLNLEITESVVLGHAEDTISKMTDLKSLGISFAIDDFGAGYSSLSYLKRLPADELKIDRSFIQDIPKDGDNMAIVEAVIAMARHMGFNVTAEGVESRQQLEFLKAQGCSFYQGYLASKPLPVPYLEKYVQRLARQEYPREIQLSGVEK
ncbi:putative bifunctional diguanylate cyclase/phosphodiesterase [Aeromonas jandaei]|uniref:putative bifunctional diguanylate cyclase/phosphodiesterase n=1 Tax=Aeromonas jandaei TaxID=650 RepID=UPI0039898987